MTNLEVCLITFIITLIFVGSSSTTISDKRIRECKYLSMPDGSLWMKVEEGKNEIHS